MQDAKPAVKAEPESSAKDSKTQSKTECVENRKNSGQRKTKVRSWYIPPGIPVFLFLGLQLIVIWVALVVISAMWPGNRIAALVFEQKNRSRLLVEVTSQSRSNLHAAQIALARADQAGFDNISILESRTIGQGLLLATELTKLFAKPTPLNFETAAARSGASARIAAAIMILDARTQQRLSQGGVKLIWRALFPFLDKDVESSPLTPLEEARYSELLKAWILENGGATTLGAKDLDLMALLLGIGMAAGALRAAVSIATRYKYGKLQARWVPSALIRPVEGGLLAVAFYFVLRAGLFTANVGAAPGQDAAAKSVPDPTNLFGAYTIAMFAGLFSREAMEKLRSVAEAFFDKTVEDKRPSIVTGNVSMARFSSLAIAHPRAFLKDLQNTSDDDGADAILKKELGKDFEELKDDKVGDERKIALVSAALNRLMDAPDLQTRFQKASGAEKTKALLEPLATDSKERFVLNRHLLQETYAADLLWQWKVLLHGANFRPDSIVSIEGRPISPPDRSGFIDPATLCMDLTGERYKPGTELSFAVSNPSPDAGHSDTFKVTLG